MSDAARLEIGREDFIAAVQRLNRVRVPSKNNDALLSFDGACLHIEVQGVTVAVPARGHWDGQATISARIIHAYAVLPLKDDPVALEVHEGRFRLGSIHALCGWNPAWSALIQAPINADDTFFMALKLRYTPEQIRQSGMERMVAAAETRCARRIRFAAKALSPYQIPAAEIRALVDRQLRASGAADRV